MQFLILKHASKDVPFAVYACRVMLPYPSIYVCFKRIFCRLIHTSILQRVLQRSLDPRFADQSLRAEFLYPREGVYLSCSIQETDGKPDVLVAKINLLFQAFRQFHRSGITNRRL